MTDQLLVQRCITGDAEAWRQLIQTCSPTLRAFARISLRALGAGTDEADLDDVCSAVFESLVAGDFRVLRSFRWQCSFETWLRLLVRTAAVRSVRRKTVDRADLPLQQPAGLPLDLILSAEARDVVREEVDRLPARERKVLRMFFLDGKSYRDIAEALRLPMGTVATLMARTRAALRDRLEKRGLTETD
jgi:RNA polymerase sigma-70 factor (ECF subfamily)